MAAISAAGLALACAAACRSSPDPRTLDELLRRVNAASGVEEARLVEAFARAHPTNPVIDGSTVAFLVPGDPDQPPRIIGDFNAWGRPDGAGEITGGTMTRIGRTRWFLLERQLPLDARVEYLIAFAADDFRPDPRNPLRADSVGGPASEVRMPGFVTQTEADPAARVPSGSLERHTVGSPSLGTSRVVGLYKPHAYDNRQRYPAVFFNDGVLMMDKGVARILDALAASKVIPPAVAVFVEPVSRADEYRQDPAYRRFIIDDLLPWVEARASITTDPRQRAVVGVSRGAIPAVDLAWHHPDRFGLCGLLLPSFAPTNVIDLIRSGPRKPVMVAVVAGRFDSEWLGDARALDRALTERGYRYRFLEVPEGHNVQTWRGHLDDVLVALLGRPPGEAPNVRR